MKGKLNEECNRTACQKPGAVYYNHSTREHYCAECAYLINMANHNDAMRMFGHKLCTPVSEDRFIESSKWWKEIPFENKGYLIIQHLGPSFISDPGINDLSDEQIYTIHHRAKSN
jgi:hypothetical protein